MKKIYLILFSILFAISASGQKPSDAINLSEGALFIKDGSYAVNSTSATTTTHSGEYSIYTSDTTSNTVAIESGAGAQYLNFWDANINSTTNSIIVNSSGANWILNAKGTCNFTTEGTNNIGAIVIKNKTASTLTINGDSLNISSIKKAIGSIQGSIGLKSINLILDTKYLNITMPASTSIAVGALNESLRFKSISISDSCVLTCLGLMQADTIIIGKASVKVSGMSSSISINKNKDQVFCVTVPRNGTQSITVKNNSTHFAEDYVFTCAHPDDDNYYLYLPDGSYTFTSGDKEYAAEVNGAAIVASESSIAGDGIIDISKGIVVINKGGYQVGTQSYTYTGKQYTISGTSVVNSVTINGGADEITLDNVDIEPSSGCAFNINSGEDLSLILKDGTVNTLSSVGYAGLQKSQTEGMLTIKGTGTLKATSSETAGIGAPQNTDCSNITIESGTVIATTTTGQAAAIGAEGTGTCSNVFIKGGSITANNVYNAFTIGARADQTISNIQISGGKIQLYSGNNLNNPVYLLPPNVTITGGTITGKITQGSGYLMNSGAVITGGTINFEKADGSFSLAEISHPTNGVTSDYLYRSQFVIPDITEATPVTAVTVNGKNWGCNDVYTTANGLVYLWLAKNDASKYETTTVVITANAKAYTYVDQVDALDYLIAASENVSAQGNYFYQVPVNITATNATINVTDAENNIINNGSLLSSGFLDDNKPRIKVSATANSGYDNLTLSVTPSEKGSVYYMVTAAQGDTLNIEATAVISTAIANAEAGTTTLYGSNKSIIASVPVTTTLHIYTISGQEIASFVVAAGYHVLPVSTSGLYLVEALNENGSTKKKCLVR
jgi:hypothetical protein